MDLKGTITDVCVFFGKDFEPQIIDRHALASELIPERERGSDSPLPSDAVGVWRRELSRLEYVAMESSPRDDLRRLSYQPRFTGAGWRPFMAVSRWILFAMAPVLKRGIPYLQRRRVLPPEIYI